MPESERNTAGTCAGVGETRLKWEKVKKIMQELYKEEDE